MAKGSVGWNVKATKRLLSMTVGPFDSLVNKQKCSRPDSLE